MRVNIVLVLCIVLLWSCTKDEPANERYPVTQHYYVYYNSFADSTIFKATFYHRDTKTILPSGYSVTVNDSAMVMFQSPAPPSAPSAGPSYYYERIFPGNHGAFFKFKRPDGTMLQNLIPPNYVSVITFDSITTPVSRTDTLFVHVDTDTLNSGETITVSIFQDNNHFVFETVNWLPGDTVITVLPAQMSALFTGPAEITISRNSPVLPVQQPDGIASGDMRAVVFAAQDISIVQ